MTEQRRKLGKKGEDMAASYLTTLGYRVIERNFRCRLGEIDLIAEEAGDLVFVEVRTRSTTSCGLPEESVGAQKQSRLRRLAQYYLAGYQNDRQQCRFDVVSVMLDPQRWIREIKVIRNAF